MKPKPWVVVLGVMALLGGALIFRRIAPQPTPLPNRFFEVSAPPPREPSQYLYVDIKGEVVRPGVYKMKEGERVFQLIDRAGGLTADASLASVNQAALLKDGTVYNIPCHHTLVVDEAPMTPSLININTADANLLATLPGIGPATAANIVAHRETHGLFSSIDAIVEVRNIGPSTLEALRDLITH